MKEKFFFAICLFFGLMMINAGLNKFLDYMPVPDNLSEKMTKATQAFTEIGWLLPLVGVAEIIGGILCIIPKTRALGAIIIFPITIGILLINSITDTSGFPIAAVFACINLWILYENKEKYYNLID